MKSEDLVRTIAHELGHGAFGLEHTFDPEYGIDDRYNNLMGYGKGDTARLFKFQWDIAHNSKAGEDEFEDAEEVMEKPTSDIEGRDSCLFYILAEGIDDKFFNGHTLYVPQQINGKLKLSKKNYILDDDGKTVRDIETMGQLRTRLIKLLSLDNNPNVEMIGYKIVRNDTLEWKLGSRPVKKTQFDALDKGFFELPLDQSGTFDLEVGISDILSIDLAYRKDGELIMTRDTLKSFVKLKIVIYRTGMVAFSPNDKHYYENYSFDDALDVINQAENDYGPPINIAGTKYYVPWIGVEPNKEVEIKLEYKLKDSGIKPVVTLESENLNLKFSENQKNKLTINNIEDLQNIKFKIVTQGVFKIRAYSKMGKAPRVLIGQLNGESKSIVKEYRVRIIRLKTRDASAYPEIDREKIITELNTKAYKQAFVKFSLDPTSFEKELPILKTDEVKPLYVKENCREFIDDDQKINLFIIGETKNKQDGSSATEMVTKLRPVSLIYNTTDYAVIAHEIGHNLGLSHPFVIRKRTSGTTNNIMDYGYHKGEPKYYFYLYEIRQLDKW